MWYLSATTIPIVIGALGMIKNSTDTKIFKFQKTHLYLKYERG